VLPCIWGLLFPAVKEGPGAYRRQPWESSPPSALHPPLPTQPYSPYSCRLRSSSPAPTSALHVSAQTLRRTGRMGNGVAPLPHIRQHLGDRRQKHRYYVYKNRCRGVNTHGVCRDRPAALLGTKILYVQ
jgi:hypothetical protein